MSAIEFISNSPEQTQELAANIAGLCIKADCITLSGDLGTGKTCFAQGLVKALAGNVQVQSPTFLLVKPYECPTSEQIQTLYHMDLYRIEHEAELEELGLDEYLASGLCLIEWPDIAKNYLPDNHLAITIENMESNHQRKITFFAKDDWQKRLKHIHLQP